MPLAGFTALEACRWAGVSRAGFYRHYQEHAPREADTDLRALMQSIVIENRFYGYRRVVLELQKQGIFVNGKRVLRLMREDNLLALRRRRFLFTTDSHHPFAVYPNLAGRLQVTGINQLWVADITYIRLRESFVYLAVILDAFSRRVIGWDVSETLEAGVAVRALDRALADRAVGEGVVHHSDRGVQYCCGKYVGRLEQHGFVISMSRRGNPYDNARAESFMATLKREEVALRRYRDLAEVRASIGHFIESVYNERRLHSALGYRPPAEFEKLQRPGGEL